MWSTQNSPSTASPSEPSENAAWDEPGKLVCERAGRLGCFMVGF